MKVLSPLHRQLLAQALDPGIEDVLMLGANDNKRGKGVRSIAKDIAPYRPPAATGMGPAANDAASYGVIPPGMLELLMRD